METRSADPRKYADALIVLAEAAGDLDGLERDLSTVLAAIEESEDLRRFLADSRIMREGKSLALDRMLKGQIGPVLLNFLRMLQEQQRLHDLPELAGICYQRVSESRRMAAGELVAARPVSPSQVALIEQEVSRILNKDVHLRTQVDPDLLGGVRVRVGDLVLDGTLEHYFRSVQERLGC
jgi:F-type H+-transporting ATPase subunit delta